MKISELLSAPDKWTQCTYARDSSGNETDISSPNACKWCFSAAITLCYPDERRTRAMEILRRHMGNFYCIPAWNDAVERTYEEVIAAAKEIDAVLEAERSEKFCPPTASDKSSNL